MGKTSVAAALSVAAARQGKRVLALTVDPAGRLADSLGVERRQVEHQPIEAEKLSQLGIGEGSLSVAILDPQRTLNELVERLAGSLAQRDAIIEHPLFVYLSDYLAGTNEFMAVEKLLQSLDSPDYDLIVLDTPPTRHALDFLQAPQRFGDALDSPLLKALVRAVDETRRFSVDWVSKSLASLVRGMGKLTGAGTLEQVATLLLELGGVFGGFHERAKAVAEAFLDPSFGFVLVARPTAAALSDASYFAAALDERAMRAAALVINRRHEGVASSLRERGLRELRRLASAELLERIERALDAHQRLVDAESEQLHLIADDPRLERCLHVSLPSVAGGVAELNQLAALADVIEGAGLGRTAAQPRAGTGGRP